MILFFFYIFTFEFWVAYFFNPLCVFYRYTEKILIYSKTSKIDSFLFDKVQYKILYHQ